MFSKGEATSITYNDIIDKVSEYDILSYYLGPIEVPSIINSPLREDKNPSFGLYSPDGVKIRYKDLATKDCGGAFDLLGKYFSYSFKETVNKVYKDLCCMKSTDTKLSSHFRSSKCMISSSPSTILECKIRDWKDYDLEYWESYGVSKRMLEYCEVYPVRTIFITKGIYKFSIAADKYAYVYVERKDGQVTLKIYQPYSKRHKWSNNHNSSVWSLWTKIPTFGANLIITSSTKDAMCIMDNTGIPSVALQGEGYIPKAHVVKALKDRFKNVYVLYDNDFDSVENHGHMLGENFAKLFRVRQIEIPLEFKSKDISDLAMKYGRSKVKEVIYSLIKN